MATSDASEGVVTAGKAPITLRIKQDQVAVTSMQRQLLRCRFGEGSIGIEIRSTGKCIRVIHVQPDSPSARQGVILGDVLTELNGQPIPSGMHELDFLEAVKKLRRPIWISFTRAAAAPTAVARTAVGQQYSPPPWSAQLPHQSSAQQPMQLLSQPQQQQQQQQYFHQNEEEGEQVSLRSKAQAMGPQPRVVGQPAKEPKTSDQSSHRPVQTMFDAAVLEGRALAGLREAIVAGGGDPRLVDGFTCKVDHRQADKNGNCRRDVTFYDPTRSHRFRSRSEVQRHFNLVDTHGRSRLWSSDARWSSSTSSDAAATAAAAAVFAAADAASFASRPNHPPHPHAAPLDLNNPGMAQMGSFANWLRARKTQWRAGHLWRMKWDRRERGAEHELTGAEARGDFSGGLGFFNSNAGPGGYAAGGHDHEDHEEEEEEEYGVGRGGGGGGSESGSESGSGRAPPRPNHNARKQQQGAAMAFHRKRKRSHLPSVLDNPRQYESEAQFKVWLATRQSEWRDLRAIRKRARQASRAINVSGHSIYGGGGFGGTAAHTAAMSHGLGSLRNQQLLDHHHHQQLQQQQQQQQQHGYRMAAQAPGGVPPLHAMTHAANGRLPLPPGGWRTTGMASAPPPPPLARRTPPPVPMRTSEAECRACNMVGSRGKVRHTCFRRRVVEGDPDHRTTTEYQLPRHYEQEDGPWRGGAGNNAATPDYSPYPPQYRPMAGAPRDSVVHQGRRMQQQQQQQQEAAAAAAAAAKAAAIHPPLPRFKFLHAGPIRMPTALVHGAWRDQDVYGADAADLRARVKGRTGMPLPTPGENNSVPQVLPGSVDAAAALLSEQAAARARQHLGEQSEDGLLVKVRQAWELVKRNKLNMEEEAFRGTLNRQGLQDLSNLAADALALCWWRVLIVVLRTLALTACDDDFVARTVSATGILHTASVAIVEAGVAHPCEVAGGESSNTIGSLSSSPAAAPPSSSSSPSSVPLIEGTSTLSPQVVYQVRQSVCQIAAVLMKNSSERTSAVVHHGILPILCYLTKYMKAPIPNSSRYLDHRETKGLGDCSAFEKKGDEAPKDFDKKRDTAVDDETLGLKTVCVEQLVRIAQASEATLTVASSDTDSEQTASPVDEVRKNKSHEATVDEVEAARFETWESACQTLMLLLLQSQEARVALPNEMFHVLATSRQSSAETKLEESELLGEEMAILANVGGMMAS